MVELPVIKYKFVIVDNSSLEELFTLVEWTRLDNNFTNGQLSGDNSIHEYICSQFYQRIRRLKISESDIVFNIMNKSSFYSVAIIIRYNGLPIQEFIDFNEFKSLIGAPPNKDVKAGVVNKFVRLKSGLKLVNTITKYGDFETLITNPHPELMSMLYVDNELLELVGTYVNRPLNSIQESLYSNLERCKICIWFNIMKEGEKDVKHYILETTDCSYYPSIKAIENSIQSAIDFEKSRVGIDNIATLCVVPYFYGKKGKSIPCTFNDDTASKLSEELFRYLSSEVFKEVSHRLFYL